MKLNSIDTNRLVRNLTYIMLAIDSGNESPVVITRFKRAAAVIFPIHYNTKTEAWAVRAVISLKPSDLKRNMSRLMSSMANKNCEEIVVLMQPSRVMNKSIVIVPVSIAEQIIGESITHNDEKFKPLPYTDMSGKRPTAKEHSKFAAQSMSKDLYNKIKGDVNGLG